MRPKESMLALAALLGLAAAGCGGEEAVPRKPAGPSLEVTAPPLRVGGNVVTLPVRVTGLSIVKADGDTSGRTGHFHVFLDRDPLPEGQIIPKEEGIVHSADNPIKLYGLAVGPHRATVVLGDGTHRRILGQLAKRVDFTVEGPAVQASAPATSPAGQPVTVQLRVEGVQLVPANGDTSGKTGHLHLFVDREPTGAGQPIPKEPGIIHTTETAVQVPGLAPGEHTIWVVVGDGNHVPLRPPVMAKVTVTVQ